MIHKFYKNGHKIVNFSKEEKKRDFLRIGMFSSKGKINKISPVLWFDYRANSNR